MDEIRTIESRILFPERDEEVFELSTGIYWKSGGVIFVGPRFSILSSDEQRKVLHELEPDKNGDSPIVFIQPDKHFAFERTNFSFSTTVKTGFYRETLEGFLDEYFRFFKIKSAEYCLVRRKKNLDVCLEALVAQEDHKNCLLIAVCSNSAEKVDQLFLEPGKKWRLSVLKKHGRKLRRLARASIFRLKVGIGKIKSFFWENCRKVRKFFFQELPKKLCAGFQKTKVGLATYCFYKGLRFSTGLKSLKSLHQFKFSVDSFFKSIEAGWFIRGFLRRRVLCFGLLCSHASLDEVLVTARRASLVQADWERKKPTIEKRSSFHGGTGKSVLIVSAMFPTRMHAGGLRVYDIISTLHSRGFDVSLFSVAPNREEEACWRNIKPLIKKHMFVPERRFTPGSIAHWLETTNSSFDVSHFEWPLAAELLNHSQKGRMGRRIFTYHEVVTKRVLIDLRRLNNGKIIDSIEWALSGRFKEGINSLYLEHLAAKNADDLICVTEEDSVFLEKLLGTKSKVIPTCISRTINARLGLSVKTNSVGFFGYYHHYPNVDGLMWYLQHIHNRVLSKVPDYCFYIFGKGSLQKVRNRFEGLRNVIWVGEVAEVSEAIYPNELMVAPLINGAGIRGKVNQYSFFGKPTVGTSIAAEGLPYEDGKSILISDSPDLFAEHIVNLLVDKDRARKIGRESKKLCEENFSWERQIDKLVSLYA